MFRERVASFEQSYGWAVEALVLLKRPAWVCTIYHGNLMEPDASRAPVAIALFNDAIVRTALRFGVGVIDLRSVCSNAHDFANPIEPSGTGGRKIAQAVVRALAGEGIRMSG